MSSLQQDFTPKLPPLPHQVEAIRYVSARSTSALFDEQGLGKTKIVIDALSQCMRHGEIDAALVVAPLSLVYIWEQEIAKHSHLVPMVLRGTQKERRYRLLTGANFYLVNYEGVVAELDRMKRLCRSRRFALVLDEAARIKDPATKTASALFQLSPLTSKRIILTGTPVANNPLDLWSQFFFLDRGELLGSDFKAFRREYECSGEDYQNRLMVLREIVVANSMRRLKGDVLELPDKSYRNVFVTLGGRQLEMYSTLRQELQLEVQAMDGTRFVDEAENILKRLLRLTQVASNPSLIDRSYCETPAKFAVLDDLVEELTADDGKAVVWSSFVDNIQALKTRFHGFSPVVIHGAVPVADRAVCVAKFQEDPRCRVMIANPAAAREGLTLTRANHAIYVDRNFNLVDYLQSQDRIHRISQTRPCVVHKLLAKGTVDEYVDRVIELKTDIASFTQGDNKALGTKTLDEILSKRELLQMLGG